MVLFLLTWPGKGMIQHPERRSGKKLDFLGSLLLIAASVLVVFAFQEGGLKPNSWPTALFLAPLLIGIFCWCILFAWETFASHRGFVSTILPPRLLRRRVYISAVMVTMASGYINFTAVYSLPLHFQIVNGTSPLTAGVSLLPLLGSVAVGSMLGGFTLNHTFPALASASSFMALGTGLLSTLTLADHVQTRTYGFEVLLGLGVGLSISSSTLVAATDSEKADHAIAQGIVAQSRVLGGSIGIAASTAILGVMSKHSTLSDPKLAERTAYADAFGRTMWVCAIIACLSLLFSMGTWKRKRDKKSLGGVSSQPAEPERLDGLAKGESKHAVRTMG